MHQKHPVANVAIAVATGVASPDAAGEAVGPAAPARTAPTAASASAADNIKMTAIGRNVRLGSNRFMLMPQLDVFGTNFIATPLMQ